MKRFNLKSCLIIFTLGLWLTLAQGNLLPARANWNEETYAAGQTYENGSQDGIPGSGNESGNNASQPRLMVTEFEIDGGSVKPNQETTLYITFQNCSKKKYVSNIKLSIQDETGDILPRGTGTKYVDCIYAGDSYLWDVEVKAAKTATVGEHKLTITAEYEDKYYTAYTNTDTLLVPVKQKTDLSYSGMTLPKKVIQNQTTSMDITLMNTGKSLIRNAKVEVQADGLATGGPTFLGEIATGTSQSASINLQVDSSLEGQVQGTATLTYEDEFGKEYKQVEKLSTTIEKQAEPQKAEEKEQKKKALPLWWAFLLAGIASGGGATYGSIRLMAAKKQRQEDELRL